MRVRREYHCPVCHQGITEELMGPVESEVLSCPHCSVDILLPRIGKAGESDGTVRRDKRCPVKLKVTYPSTQEFQSDYTKNISRGGLFVMTSNPPELGTKVDINLHLPELADPINIIGEVVHSQDPGHGGDDPGVGLKFLDMDPLSRGTLASYLSYLSDCV